MLAASHIRHVPLDSCRWFHLAVLVSASLALLVQAAAGATLRVPADHKSIQGAIDAASPGDTVLVEAGTYKERLRLKSGIIVRSAGDDTKGKLGLARAETTILDGGGDAGKGAGVEMAEGATLDGFTVTNVGTYDDALWNKHHATHGNEQAHEHIGQPGTPGIGVTGVNCTVTNNIVHHIGYTGIAIMGAQGKRTSPHILANVCYRNMGGGIGSMKQSTAVIEGNICFQNFYAGIGHNRASPLVVDNTCYENIRAGIGVSEGSSPVVRGNKCYRNRRAGIGIRTGADTQPVIEKNDCYENDMAGIGNTEEAQPIIRNNRCYRNKMAGIGSEHGARPIIAGNECFENQLAGIGQRSDAQTIVVGNHSHHNKTAGIGFESSSKGKAIVAGNRFEENVTVAVGIHEGWKVHLIDNELSRTGGMPPIVMVFEGAEATFVGNTIKGSGVAGIRVAGRVDVSGNRFIGTAMRKGGPPNFAIWGLPGSRITFSGNIASGWRHAVSADRATVAAWDNEVSDYWQAGIRVSEPTAPVHAFNNLFKSEAGHAALSIHGDRGFTEGNRVEKGEKPDPGLR